ncbi:hypothetical protein [Alcaligenes aquatilis]
MDGVLILTQIIAILEYLNAFFARMEQNEGVKAALRGEGLFED